MLNWLKLLCFCGSGKMKCVPSCPPPRRCTSIKWHLVWYSSWNVGLAGKLKSLQLQFLRVRVSTHIDFADTQTNFCSTVYMGGFKHDSHYVMASHSLLLGESFLGNHFTFLYSKETEQIHLYFQANQNLLFNLICKKWFSLYKQGFQVRIDL